MFSSLKGKLNGLKDDVLKQKVKGRFVSKGLSKHAPFLFILSLVCIVLGGIMTSTYYNLYEVIVPYENASIYLPKSTIYFYIQIDDFYQTNLKYSKSISYNQLKGEKDTNSKTTEPLDAEDGLDYYPAGILPNTFLQDTFTFTDLDIKTDNISWSSIRKKIKPSGYSRDEVLSPPLWQEYSTIPDLSRNERFINWISTAPFYNFRKLWGKIDVPENGVYNLQVESDFPYGNKSLMFSEMSWAGTKNYFLSLSLMATGVLGLAFSYLLYTKVMG